MSSIDTSRLKSGRYFSSDADFREDRPALTSEAKTSRVYRFMENFSDKDSEGEFFSKGTVVWEKPSEDLLLESTEKETDFHVTQFGRGIFNARERLLINHSPELCPRSSVAWKKTSEDFLKESAEKADASDVVPFNRGILSAKESLKIKCSSELERLQGLYEKQKAEYEHSYRKLLPSTRTLALYMDRNKIESHAECVMSAKDVLDTCIQLLDLYARPGFVESEELRESYKIKCRSVFEFAKSLSSDLPIIFESNKPSSVIIDRSQVQPISVCFENNDSSQAKLLARIALIEMKAREAFLVLEEDKNSDLIFCIKSLFEPLKTEIRGLLEERKVKGRQFFIESKVAKEEKMLIKVRQIFGKIEEAILIAKLMSFDAPIHETVMPVDASVLTIKYHEQLKAYNEAMQKIHLESRSSSFFGYDIGKTIVQEDGIACIDCAEQFLKFCNFLMDGYLGGISSMSDLEMGTLKSNISTLERDAESVLNGMVLILGAFKRKHQKEIRQRNRCLLSFSTRTDDLINQIAQKKAMFIGKFTNIKLQKIEAYYQMILSKQLREESEYFSEKALMDSFLKDTKKAIHDLLEGKGLPGEELVRRVEAILDSIELFESNLGLDLIVT